jgi:putative transposase
MFQHGCFAKALSGVRQAMSFSMVGRLQRQRAAAVHIVQSVIGCLTGRDSFEHHFTMMPDLPDDEDCLRGTRHWPHAPPHRLAESGVYFVTARTREKKHLLHTPERRDWFLQILLDGFAEAGWKLEAWAVLSNHYHVVAHSPPGGAETLRVVLQKLHSLATKRLNAEDGTPGRTRLWQNYRETHLTYPQSYLARLNYVHQNPRHHGLVPLASQWRWCSADDFKREATAAWVTTVASFPYDEIAAEDGE